ncbi:MAG: hypothetical protein ACLTGJ_05430, partial [Faecalibacterium prausnitzii]
PQEYNWGGSYIHACTGTDNLEHVRDIILALTSNKDNLLKISKDYLDFTNTMSGMRDAATDDSFASSFLGGQNAYEYFAPVAENIKIAPPVFLRPGLRRADSERIQRLLPGQRGFRPGQGKLRDCHHGALS